MVHKDERVQESGTGEPSEVGSRANIVSVPEGLKLPLQTMNTTILRLFGYSTAFESGPNLVLQMILLLLIKIVAASDPDYLSKLKHALDVANDQFRSENGRPT